MRNKGHTSPKQIQLRDAPPQKKRENVGILKKQGGGLPESRFNLLLFLTFDILDHCSPFNQKNIC